MALWVFRVVLVALAGEAEAQSTPAVFADSLVQLFNRDDWGEAETNLDKRAGLRAPRDTALLAEVRSRLEPRRVSTAYAKLLDFAVTAWPSDPRLYDVTVRLAENPADTVAMLAVQAAVKAWPDNVGVRRTVLGQLRGGDLDRRLTVLRGLSRAVQDDGSTPPDWAFEELYRHIPEWTRDPENWSWDPELGDATGGAPVRSTAAVRQLVAWLSHPDGAVRLKSMSILADIAPSDSVMVSRAAPLLRDRDPRVRLQSAQYMWLSGADPRGAAGAIKAVVVGGDTTEALAREVSIATMKIAYTLRDQTADIPFRALRDHVAAVDTLLPLGQRLGSGTDSITDSELPGDAVLRQARRELVEEQRLRVLQAIWAHPGARIAAAAAAYLLVLLMAWALVLRYRPLWALRLGDFVDDKLTLRVPAVLGFGGFQVSVRTVTLLRRYHHHPRVLDAWVAAYREVVRGRYALHPTVAQRSTYVPMAVTVDGQEVDRLGPAALRPVLGHARSCLLIAGEGGAGKTTLAVQLGWWCLSADPSEWPYGHGAIPVLLESECGPGQETGTFLRESVRRRLRDLMISPTEPRVDLVERLLRERRIVVIFDHYSELAERTREVLSPDRAEYPANALIVTSRWEEDLGVTRSVVRPRRITGSRLATFLEEYLERCGKRRLFSASEFFSLCAEVSTVVGESEITPLFATRYADVKIAAKEGRSAALPRSIPELVVAYVKEINGGDRERNKGAERKEWQENRRVLVDVKRLAWAMVAPELRAGSLTYEEALAALGGECPEDRLRYLEDDLRLVQPVGVAENQLRFSLDPVAECLAAIHFVETHSEDHEAWDRLLARIHDQSGPGHGGGFAAALRLCTTTPSLFERIPLRWRDDVSTPESVPE